MRERATAEVEDNRGRRFLRIESLVHGGEGLARDQGRVVFVRGGAPGDRVEVEIEPSAADRFQRARVLRVLEPGPARVQAPCPIVDRCGGCPVQHVSAAEQLATRRSLSIDALERIGGIPEAARLVAETVPSPQPFRYRRRARLHRGRDGGWGFGGGGSAVEPAECLLFEPALQELFDAVRAHAAAAGGLPQATDLGLDTDADGRGAIDLRTEGPPGKALRKRAERLLAEVPRLRGLVVGPPGAGLISGDPVLIDAQASHGGPAFRLRSRPDLFAQANRAAVPLLQAQVLAALGDAAEGRVLELFCGSGTFTLPLLGRARSLVGVESAAASLGLLRRSAEEAGLAGRLRLIASDAARAARGLAAEGSSAFDAVLLDPPRTGAPEAVRAAAELAPRRIVYVSCDAPTLGRDARDLRARGYALTRALPFDLFPQTAHLEVVATFDRLA